MKFVIVLLLVGILASRDEAAWGPRGQQVGNPCTGNRGSGGCVASPGKESRASFCAENYSEARCNRSDKCHWFTPGSGVSCVASPGEEINASLCAEKTQEGNCNQNDKCQWSTPGSGVWCVASPGETQYASLRSFCAKNTQEGRCNRSDGCHWSTPGLRSCTCADDSICDSWDDCTCRIISCTCDDGEFINYCGVFALQTPD